MRIEEHGLQAAITGLGILRGRLTDTQPLMQQIGQMLSNSTVERFHTKKAPDGSQWRDLRPATIHRKGHNNILVDSRDLMDSITFSAVPLAVRIYSTDPNQGKVKGHQEGNPATALPQRAIFGLSQGDKEDIFNIVSLWLEATE